LKINQAFSLGGYKQQKVFVSMINDIYTAMKKGAGKNILDKILDGRVNCAFPSSSDLGWFPPL